MDPPPIGEFVVFRQPFPFLISSDWISLIDHHKPPMTNQPPKQLKQRYYYIFWSIATLAVVVGQVYVACSYRDLASALRQVLLNG